MKDIIEVKFSGECKAPIFTTRRGKHLFCGEPAPEGKSYCAPCGRRMVLPTRHYVDTPAMADALGGGKARTVSRENSGEQNHVTPVDGFIRGVGRGLGGARDEARSAAFMSRIKVIA